MLLVKKYLILMSCILLVFLLNTSLVRAQNDGQAKLDEATEKKLDANTPEKLAEVIRLCEEALDAGLNEGNQRIAKQVLAASALQLSQTLFQDLPAIASNRRALTIKRREIMSNLEKAVANNPELSEAFLLLARLEAIPGGSREKAIDYMTKAIELLKDKPVDQSQAYLLRAAIQEDEAEQLADLKAAIEADPTNEAAWQTRLRMLIAVGKFEQARQDAESLLQNDPDNRLALETAVDSLLQLRREADAIALLNPRIEKDPENGDLRRMRGRAYALSDEDEKALADLNKAIELDPRDHQSLILRGQIYFDMGESEKASRDISDSLLIEPQSVQGIWMRAMVASREQRYADAIADVEMLVRAIPSNVEWILVLANFYQLDNRPRLAIRLMDELIRQQPDNWRALRMRGDAKLSINEHSLAIADYEAATKLMEESREVEDARSRASDDDYSGLLNNLSWVLATSPKDELRDGAKALEMALKACEATDYKEAHILSTLAAAYAETGDFENARKWSGKAVELGAAEEHAQLDQLKAELESYEKNEPWREKQETEENKAPLVAPAETIDT